MTFQSAPNGIEVVLDGSQNGIPVVNVFHVDNGASVAEADLIQVAETFQDWWTVNMASSFHPSYSLNNIKAKDISIEDGVEITIPLTTGNIGTAAGEPMAANAALVMSMRTTRTGRSYRGRTYVGGLTNNYLVDAHNVSATTANGFASGYMTLLEAIVAGGRKLAVLSRWLNKALRVAAVLTEIVEIIADTKVDSQRRRTAN